MFRSPVSTTCSTRRQRGSPVHVITLLTYLFCLVLEMALVAFSAMTLLVGRQEGHPACKKTEWWGAGVVICLKRGADLHTTQLVPLPLTVSCFSKIQIGFTFLVPAHPGSPWQRAVKWVCMCVLQMALSQVCLSGSQLKWYTSLICSLLILQAAVSCIPVNILL